MSVDKEIYDYLQKLPSEAKNEVLDFVKFLNQKNKGRRWSEFSLSTAMRGMEKADQPEYTKEDIVDHV